jgi:putative DNA primase/helicase
VAFFWFKKMKPSPTNFFNETLHYERALLGAILAFPDAYRLAVVAGLQRHYFSLKRHSIVFDCAAHLDECSLAVELPTVSAELAKRGWLESVGGDAYLSSLMDGVPGPGSVPVYVVKLKGAASRRRLENIVEEFVTRGDDPNMSNAAFAEVGHELIAAASGNSSVAPTFSEDGLALRFADLHGDRLRYVSLSGRWMIWNGTRWAVDDTQQVLDMVRELCRSASMMCKHNEQSTARRLASKSTALNVLHLASADRRLAATPQQWDLDVWSLNTPSGTVDLRTGQIREHRGKDYITKSAAASPAGDCPLWLAFLNRITDGDVELQNFLQRSVGYALTGTTSEHALFFLYGTGANGKSVFLSVLAGLLGDYAQMAPMSTFIASSSEQHPTDLARLQGARFVTATEIEDGTRWAESRIKSLTGGDKITARFMRGNFFEFLPQLKLFIGGNRLPGLRGVDEAIKRRMHVIPFAITIPKEERDLGLLEKLKSEYPGIIAWAIQGCLQWQAQGLNPPSLVLDATREYLSSEDLIGRWIEDRAIVVEGVWTPNAKLYANYRGYCTDEGEVPIPRRCFTQQLAARGFRTARKSHARGTAGIDLRRGL